MKIIVTTTQSVHSIDEGLQEIINESGFAFVERSRKSLNKLCIENSADGVIVWENQGPVLYIDNDKFFFHPSMAKNRIASFRKNNTADLMIKVSKLEKGDDFLDCTLGLGADSIVAAYFSEYGNINSLEYNKAVAWVIKWGMKLYNCDMKWLNQAIKRINVINQDHRSFLLKQADLSYDIVYFDPMFERPLLKSQSISPLRRLAYHEPLALESVQEACRVARKSVVMKQLNSSQEFERLGFNKISCSRHNPIAYGVIYK